MVWWRSRGRAETDLGNFATCHPSWGTVGLPSWKLSKGFDTVYKDLFIRERERVSA